MADFGLGEALTRRVYSLLSPGQAWIEAQIDEDLRAMVRRFNAVEAERTATAAAARAEDRDCPPPAA